MAPAHLQALGSLAAVGADLERSGLLVPQAVDQVTRHEHAGEWADACRACAIDKRLGGSA